jgi:hypothetical protein
MGCVDRCRAGMGVACQSAICESRSRAKANAPFTFRSTSSESPPILKTGTFYLAGKWNFLLGSDKRPQSKISGSSFREAAFGQVGGGW